MMLRVFGLGWAFLLVALATGCCTGGGYCTGGFEQTPLAEPCSRCASAGAPCDSCAGRPGLFSYIKNTLTCGSGCGEFYLHPWINDAPDACDPCDNHGNWIGHGNCSACNDEWGSCARIGHLWGYRANEHCNSCGGGVQHGGVEYGDVQEEGAVQDEDVVQGRDVDFGIVETRGGAYEGAVRDVQIFEGQSDAVTIPPREKTVYNRRTYSRKTVGKHLGRRPTTQR